MKTIMFVHEKNSLAAKLAVSTNLQKFQESDGKSPPGPSRQEEAIVVRSAVQNHPTIIVQSHCARSFLEDFRCWKVPGK